MRVMLDTNVLISAIIFPNERMDSLIYKAALDHKLVLSSYVIDELLDVTKMMISPVWRLKNQRLSRHRNF